MKVPQNTAKTKPNQNEKRTPDFMNGSISPIGCTLKNDKSESPTLIMECGLSFGRVQKRGWGRSTSYEKRYDVKNKRNKATET